MPINSSFPTVADQIVTYNKNLVEILSSISSLSSTTESSVTVQIFNDQGVLTTYSLPSFGFLKSEIDRLNNNINSLFSIDTPGALIQNSSQNVFKKVITIDLNTEPNSLDQLQTITTFNSTKNWFFDGLLNPLLWVGIDLSGKIANDVTKCLSRRYLVEFEKDQSGNFTPLGQSALNSFNQLYRGKTNVDITAFEQWYANTPGVVNPTTPNFDEKIVDLEPNTLKYDGQFSVLRIEEDRLNRKLWYVLDTLDYLETAINKVHKLAINDLVIINSTISQTQYQIIEVSTAESNFRVRFQRVEGLDPIPVGIGVLKIYSPVTYTKTLQVTIGYNERSVVFVKPMNTENYLLAKNWSQGTGFWTNDLRLTSTDTQNGLTMEQYYINFVYDYGVVLQDLVAKKTPNVLAAVPASPVLDPTNFKVVQTNTHLTDTPNSHLIKTKNNYQQSLQSEVGQLAAAIDDRNKKSKITRFTSEADKKQFHLELSDLQAKKDSKSTLLSTTTQEIIDLSKSPLTNVDPKFSVRGFWNLPNAAITNGTQPQEVIQFRIQYRFTSKDGRESPVETFSIKDNSGLNKTAAFSNWNEIKTDVRQRTFDPQTGLYTWTVPDLQSADSPNINQLDIPLNVNETVEIRIKSISEAGWPDSPVESDWSPPVTISFPDDLNNVTNNNASIVQDAQTQSLKTAVQSDLTAKGLDEHLSDTTVVNQVTIHHTSDKLLSGFKDQNGVALTVLEYLTNLTNRILALEETILRSQGVLNVSILRNNQEFVITNNTEQAFNIECEDYLTSFTGTGIPTGRVYANDIVVIKDFVLKVKNDATASPLGLLSNKTYLNDTSVYNTSAPQVFWVNDQDELMSSSISGQTRAQLDNQFIWQVNYDTINQSTVVKLSENIGNSFVTDNNNSITDELSSTEYNVGYNETSILSFVGNNISLLDPSKWVDSAVTVASTTKLLTTIHPVVKDLESIVDNNSTLVHTVNGGDANSIIIPINIYFKLNALDSNQTGLNYQYVNLNGSTQTVKHIKKLKFLLENEADNRPFVFTLKFNINRNKVIIKKNVQAINTSVR
jgi:hypothetical protein